MTTKHSVAIRDLETRNVELYPSTIASHYRDSSSSYVADGTVDVVDTDRELRVRSVDREESEGFILIRVGEEEIAGEDNWFSDTDGTVGCDREDVIWRVERININNRVM